MKLGRSEKKVAHGVSRGKTAKSAEPRQGRKYLFRPLRGLSHLLTVPRLAPWATFFRPLRGLPRLLTSPAACAVGYFLSPPPGAATGAHRPHGLRRGLLSFAPFRGLPRLLMPGRAFFRPDGLEKPPAYWLRLDSCDSLRNPRIRHVHVAHTYPNCRFPPAPAQAIMAFERRSLQVGESPLFCWSNH